MGTLLHTRIFLNLHPKSASLTAGTAAFFTDRLFSINAVKPYDDTFDALDNGSDEIIRLSSNENPYGPSKFVREKIPELPNL